MNDFENIPVCIAEDEHPARDLLTEYIIMRPELKLTGIARNGEEALQKLCEGRYGLLFLDIHLPILNGIEVLEQLPECPYTIFTTAYDEYAIKAFEIGAVDYLLKPFSKERFDKAVDRALTVIRNNEPHFRSPQELGLSFKEKGNHYLVAYKDIIYLSSHGRHTIVHTEGKCFETAQQLKDITQRLPANHFFRIHKQFIVNLPYVSHLQYHIGGQYLVYLKDEEKTTLPVGRLFAPPLKEKLGIVRE